MLRHEVWIVRLIEFERYRLRLVKSASDQLRRGKVEQRDVETSTFKAFINDPIITMAPKCLSQYLGRHVVGMRFINGDGF